MSKTNWSQQSKQKDNWNSPSKNKTDFNQPGDGSYSFRTPISINDPDILINEGECLVNGPLRITTYSDGKEKNKWS